MCIEKWWKIRIYSSHKFDKSAGFPATCRQQEGYSMLQLQLVMCMTPDTLWTLGPEDHSLFCLVDAFAGYSVQRFRRWILSGKPMASWESWFAAVMWRASCGKQSLGKTSVYTPKSSWGLFAFLCANQQTTDPNSAVSSLVLQVGCVKYALGNRLLTSQSCWEVGQPSFWPLYDLWLSSKDQLWHKLWIKIYKCIFYRMYTL